MDSQDDGNPFPAGLDEPVAVVGMGCRFAGSVNSPADYWRLLIEGRDAISEVPTQRWESYVEASQENAAALRRTTRFGGFLDEIDGFDAEFFGVLPREAEVMDPQQRILMEVAWEALEQAGISPTSLAGSDAGVFVGVGSDDYGRRLLEDLPRIEAWTGIGASMCAVANRISYTLDLRGPSFAVDTACSASLVALHLACRALTSGETGLALVGGVNVMAGPGLTMVLDAAGAISPDGRCKSFDASANGYGRGEGAGVIVLKRLRDAQRDGDEVLAVVCGSAVNQDGRTNGIMAPSAEAQIHLLRQAYRTSGVNPLTVDYVEAHGTGTRMGDPIEAAAMAAVLGENRPPDAPCLIGSVKSNIGHLEAGSGVAGVIKAVLALQHAEIPPSLNFTEPNPAIPWETAGLEVVTAARPWPRSDHPRRAGVSGYGYGGTIAHVVLEQAPPRPEPEPSHDGAGGRHVFAVSGPTAAGRGDVAARLADWLEGAGAGTELTDLAHTLADRRAHLTHRATVVASGCSDLVAGLRTVQTGAAAPGVSTGTATATRRPVWVFSGHGSQWVGMGRELLATEPVFGQVLDEIAPVFAAEIGFTPRAVLLGDELGVVDIIQPMIFATQVALAAVWRRRGVEPAAVVGHSVGEIAAAVTAGVLDLADGARLICRRSILLREVAGKGAMAMVGLPFDEVARRLEGRTDVVAAIVASPSSTVVSGDVPAVEALVSEWEAEQLFARRVASDVAFHSPHMAPLMDGLARAADGITPRVPKIPLYTTALDDPRCEPPRDGGYWAANLRNPVRFADAIIAAVEDGHRIFLEVSTHPVVSHSVSEALESVGIEDGFVTGSLRRGTADQATLLDNAGALHCHGVQVDLGPDGGALVELPPMAWRHRRFWRETVTGRPTLQHDTDSHTLLGGRTTVTGSTRLDLWQTYLDPTCRPYPGDHPVQDVEIIPAAVLLNTFATAAADGGRLPGLADVVLRTPVTVTTPRELQVSVQDATVRLSSRIDGDDGDIRWLTHATAGVDRTAVADQEVLDLEYLRATVQEVLPTNFVTERLAGIGVAAMGFPWQVTELRRQGGHELLAVVDAGWAEPTSWASVLDAVLSIASVVFPGPATLRMPAAIRRVVLDGVSPETVTIHIRVVDGPSAVDTVDVAVAAADGRVVARLDGLRYGVLDGDPGADVSPARLVHEIVWRPFELSTTPVDAVVVVGTGGAIDGGLAAAAHSAAIAFHRVVDADELDVLRGQLTGSSAVIVVPPPAVEGPSTVTALAAHALLVAGVVQLVDGWRGHRPRIWAVTSGAHDGALDGAAVWGIGRVAATEHADIWGGLIDVDGAAVSHERLLEVLGTTPLQDGIRIVDGETTTSRLVPAAGSTVRDPGLCRPESTYLVTGGLGALGLETARWLAGRGARRLVLAGRRPFPARSEWEACTDRTVHAQIEAVRALEALGVTVRTVALDIADAQAARTTLDPAALGLPPIAGVVHAAGVLDNRLLADLDEESLLTVMRPKAGGALVLDEMFPPGSLDFLVLFSSCGYLLGLPGQAAYGAANAVLDGLAATRQDDTISFGWTSWRGMGMSTSSVVVDMELNARGTADISLAEAFRAWEFAERRDGGRFAVLRMIGMDPGFDRIPLLAEVTVEQDVVAAADWAVDWAAMDPDELGPRLAAEVRGVVADEIRMGVDELDLRRPLLEMGLDSVMTLVIRRRLEKIFRLPLPATLLWQHPTVTAIADHLALLMTATSADPSDDDPEMPEPVIVG